MACRQKMDGISVGQSLQLENRRGEGFKGHSGFLDKVMVKAGMPA